MFAVFASALVTLAGCTRGPSKISTAFLGGIYLSQSQSVVTTSASSILAGGTMTMTLKTYDQNGAPFISPTPLSISFVTSGGTSEGTFGAVTDNGDGTYTATFTGTISGSPSNITTAISGKELSGTLPSIRVVPGTYSLTHSYVTVSTGAINSGSASLVTLHTRDGANNPLPAGGLAVSFTQSGGTSAGNFSSITDVGDGTYTATFTGTTAGTAATIGATIAGAAVAGGSSTVTVSPGAFSLAKSVVTLSSSTVASGSAITATLTARDASENRIPSGGSVVVFTRSGGTSTGVFSSTSDVGDGTYTSTFTGAVAGTATSIGATIGGSAITSALPTVTVTPGAVSLAQSSITLSATTVASGSSFTATLRTRDASGNALTNGGHTVVFSRSGGTSTGTLSSTNDVGDGAYTSTFTGAIAGTATSISATIGGSVITSTLPTVTVTPGTISLANSSITLSAVTIASGSTVTATLRARDAAGNALTSGGSTVVFSHTGGTSTGTFSSTGDIGDGTYTSIFTGAVAGTATAVSATIGGSAITSTLPTLSVTPGTISLANSSITLSATTIASGSTVTATLRTRDAAGNALTSGGATVVFSRTGGTSTGTFSSTGDIDDGTYTSTFTGAVAGTATSVSATIGGSAITSTLPTITVTPGSISLSNSSITLSAATVASGSSITATLTARDASNNTLTTGGSTVAFSVSGGTSTGTFGSTADAGNGAYTASFTGVTAGTATTVSATIGRSAVTSTLPTVSVTHGPATNIVFSAQPSDGTAGVTLATQPSVEIRDTNSNRVLTGADSTATLTISVASGTGSITGTTAVTAVNGVGIWSGLSVDMPGIKTFRVSKPNLTGSGGTAALSVTSNSFTLSADPPAVPTGLSVTTSDTKATLSWTASSGATSYEIFRGTSSGSLSSIGTSFTNSYADTAAANGTTYYYAVRAIRTAGTSASSSELTVTMLPSFTLTSVTPSVGYATLAWASSSGATKYDILYDTASRTSSGSYASSVTNVTSGANVSPLSSGTTYYFRILATGPQGTLLSTNELSSAVLQNFTMSVPFDDGTESSYVFSDTSRLEFVVGIARLKAAAQTDSSSNSSATTGFMAGSSTTGLQWDSTRTYVRLNTTTNSAEMDATWAPQWSSLAAYWKFNEAAGATTMANTANATNSGNPSNVTLGAAGQLNGAGTFNGTNSFVNLASRTANKPGFPFTISTWFRLNTLPATAYGLVTSQDLGVNETYAGYSILVNPDGSLAAQFGNNSGFCGPAARYTVTTPVGIVTTGYWYQATVVYASATDVRIYLNGKRMSQASVSGTASSIVYGSNNQLRFGYVTKLGSGCSSGDLYLNGAMDEVAIWSTGLAETEIQQIYARQSAKYSATLVSRVIDAFVSSSITSLTTLTSLPFWKELTGSAGSETSSTTTGYRSLVGSTGATTDNNLMSGIKGYWKFNETSGTYADSSGNNNTATAVGGVLANNCAGLSTTNTACRGAIGAFGYGFYVAGNQTTADFVNIPNSATLENIQEDSSTYSIWYRPELPYVAGTIFGKAGYNFGIKMNTNGKPQTEIFNSSNGYVSVVAINALAPNVWHHLVYTLDYSGSTRVVSFYIDGVLQGTAGFTTTLPYEYGTAPLRVGTTHSCSSSSSGYCSGGKGAMDEFAVWNRSLVASEVKQLYRRGANRLKYQIRTCSSDTCATEDATTTKGWVGPDGTSLTYFSELSNATIANFAATLALTTRYLQYRTVFETDDSTTSVCAYDSAAPCSPELRSVAFGPTHYSPETQTLTTKASIGSSYVSLNSFSPSTVTCAGGMKFSLSPDGTNFYYHNGSTWVASSDTAATASTGAVVSANISTFPTVVGTGTLYVKTFFQSNGSTNCQILDLQITGTKY